MIWPRSLHRVETSLFDGALLARIFGRRKEESDICVCASSASYCEEDGAKVKMDGRLSGRITFGASTVRGFSSGKVSLEESFHFGAAFSAYAR
ncbi:hypothetical protein IscW_ISCW008456 [Ixodes scapularis]|uniref:Uncharacterized protein n=1 Tax=Ixodes scapularis TaxID=6945 RepID=B7PVX0_IXOSC|nr:hypothetical protein IscW_ISCW008456 [Ixodes scapularis]|eukprot:XP_002408781.1 hypothetical protein IscW_ISCW008456 [Ixodes scapularis]